MAGAVSECGARVGPKGGQQSQRLIKPANTKAFCASGGQYVSESDSRQCASAPLRNQNFREESVVHRLVVDGCLVRLNLSDDHVGIDGISLLDFPGRKVTGRHRRRERRPAAQPKSALVHCDSSEHGGRDHERAKELL